MIALINFDKWGVILKLRKRSNTSNKIDFTCKILYFDVLHHICCKVYFKTTMYRKKMYFVKQINKITKQLTCLWYTAISATILSQTLKLSNFPLILYYSAAFDIRHILCIANSAFTTWFSVNLHTPVYL